ncbi:hypothetical protein BCR35DRAFT_306886 [Leucosporidium creatinivorum]|uniref:Uncharacterized protein n=1 Tax=Leucosporidium creatinivorum TaxID=106004 RepID=A0A1Y2ER58_9BASI|nr:hypothetical protein BCR35DRAFT_306886 [Leucosporidium creatinivorum]
MVRQGRRGESWEAESKSSPTSSCRRTHRSGVLLPFDLGVGAEGTGACALRCSKERWTAVNCLS